MDFAHFCIELDAEEVVASTPNLHGEAVVLQYVEACRLNPQHGTYRPLRVAISREQGFNALAWALSDCDGIAINFQCYGFLLGAFRACLSQGDVFSKFADPSVKEAQTSYQGDAEDLSSDVTAWPSHELRSVHREAAAHALADLAMIYITSHEYTHLRDGHLDYLATIRGIAMYREIDVPPIDAFEGITRQTLEWDADMSACKDTLLACLSATVIAGPTDVSWSIPDENMFGGVDDGIRATLLIIMVVHGLLMHPTEFIPDDFAKYSHPPASVRQWLNHVQITTVLSLRHPDYGTPTAWTAL